MADGSETDGPAEPPASPESGGDGETEDLPGIDPDDDIIPVSPARRRQATLIALVFLFGILAFLILFFATAGRNAAQGRELNLASDFPWARRAAALAVSAPTVRAAAAGSAGAARVPTAPVRRLTRASP
jgi:hypothetical protein